MLVRIQTITPAATQVISPELARRHSRIEYASDDDLITLYINSATKMCEKYLNRSILDQRLMMTFTNTHAPDTQSTPFGYGIAGMDAGSGGNTFFPFGQDHMYGKDFSDIEQDSHVNILYGPVTNVSNVIVNFWDGSSVELVSNVDFHVDLANEPARLHLHHQWFFHPRVANHQIIYDAGMAPNSTTVLPEIIHAVLLTTNRLYEQRGDGETEAVLSRAAKDFLDPHRQYVLGV